MKDVFKYARHLRPGDVDQDGRRISAVRVVLVYDEGPMLTVPADDIRMVTIERDSGVEGAMLAHLARAELAPLPGSQADEALKRLARLRALIEAAASQRYIQTLTQLIYQGIDLWDESELIG